MDTYDLCKLIRQTILNHAAENMNYCWSADFGDKRLREIPTTLKNLKFFQPIDPAKLTAEQMDDLGFKAWSEETQLRLIPLWLLPFLVDEFEAECIDGERRVFRRDELDTDHRLGCLAYGVFPTSQ